MNTNLNLAVRALRGFRQDCVVGNLPNEVVKIDTAIAAVNAAFKDAERYAKLGQLLDGEWVHEDQNTYAVVELFIDGDWHYPTTKAALDALLNKEPT